MYPYLFLFFGLLTKLEIKTLFFIFSFATLIEKLKSAWKAGVVLTMLILFGLTGEESYTTITMQS